ncbi:MAG: hypothetical protein ACRENZ_05625 [Thermodesulfobacteriota bacterium]
MSDYGSLYLIDNTYNFTRDAFEVTLGYSEKDEDVKGRFQSVKVTVSIPNHKDDEETVIDLALKKARGLVERAYKAKFEKE